jgi:hypothetical protein
MATLLNTMEDPLAVAPDLARSADGFTANRFARLRRLVEETRARKTETLRLYRPLPPQEAFHRSQAWERILRGSNRGGKTTPALMEVAWAATGTHPWINYPKTGLRIFLVGKDQRHIATVFHQKLFRWGAIKIIRDLETGLFVPYDPTNPEHADREKEAEPSPPMIPKRLIKDMAWESKKDNIWSKCTLYNENEIHAFPSGGEPPNGADVDMVLMDEEIIHRGWYPEMSMRLLDRKGRFVWSATPQNGNEQLWDLSKEAEDCKGDPEPRVEEFYMKLADNPHIDTKQKEVAAAKFKHNPEEYRVRILGEFALQSFKVYPSFHMPVHGWKMAQHGGQIPPDWSLYAAFDPGVQCAAALFGAVPPPQSEWATKYGIKLLLYGEVYVRDSDARKLAIACEPFLSGRLFQRYIIDAHGAKPRNAGTGYSNIHYYRQEFENKGFRSVETDSSFAWGNDNIRARVDAVRMALTIQTGAPALRVAEGCLPFFEYEIGRFLRKRANGLVSDEPDYRKDAHLMACLEYLVADNPQWVEPPPLQERPGRAYEAFKAWKQRALDREQQSDQVISLGPGPGKGVAA